MWHKLNIIWINQDETSKSSSTANELGLANVGGVFVVLMGGMGVACVIAVCEFVWKSRKVAVDERVSHNYHKSYSKREIFGITLHYFGLYFHYSLSLNLISTKFLLITYIFLQVISYYISISKILYVLCARAFTYVFFFVLGLFLNEIYFWWYCFRVSFFELFLVGIHTAILFFIYMF